MKITLASDEGGDWIAIYVDGKLKDQNHSLYEGDVIEALGFDYEKVMIPVPYSETNGDWPRELDQLKAEIAAYGA